MTPTWTDTDVLAMLEAHATITRLAAANATAEAVTSWRDLLDAYRAAVQANAVKHLPDMRRCLIALAHTDRTPDLYLAFGTLETTAAPDRRPKGRA